MGETRRPGLLEDYVIKKPNQTKYDSDSSNDIDANGMNSYEALAKRLRDEMLLEKEIEKELDEEREKNGATKFLFKPKIKRNRRKLIALDGAHWKYLLPDNEIDQIENPDYDEHYSKHWQRKLEKELIQIKKNRVIKANEKEKQRLKKETQKQATS